MAPKTLVSTMERGIVTASRITVALTDMSVLPIPLKKLPGITVNPVGKKVPEWVFTYGEA